MATRRIFGIGVRLAAIAALLVGCEQSVKNQAHVRPPAPVPVPATFRAESLPFPPYAPPRGYLQPSPQSFMDALIEKVQASYDAGERDYQAENLDAAREDFNRAEDLILSGGIDAKSDPRLAKLVDQLADTIHSYEIEASQEQASTENAEEGMEEPAPIEEIADLSLPAGDPRLAVRAEQELIKVAHDLPLTVNDSVLSYLSFFQTERGRDIVETGLSRAGRYHDMISRVLKEEGMPQDLIYLAQAESAFKPQAVSRAGARGIWQFMPFRGREYDLNRTWYVDERSDPEKATRAAAQHFRDLYRMFGDWYLVMAAYNSGPLNVVKAIERTGYADFWELQKRHALPKQTQNYVPIILAMALVAKDPPRYGVQVDPEKPPALDIVKPGHSIDLRLVADAIDTDVDAIQQLNPQLLRFVTPDDSEFELRLPAGTAARFKAEIAAIPPEHWKSWRLHRVEQGETFASLARHYRVTAAAIQDANHFGHGDVLPVGPKIAIPTTPEPIKLVRYRVRRGDTLEGIAERFSVAVPDLKRWNGIRGNHVARGARLRIYAGGEPPSARAASKSRSAQGSEPSDAQVENVAHSGESSADHVRHRVKPGETLYSIARQYGTSVASLREMNPFLAARSLEAGDVLTVGHPR
jgi:membrane-bound lytic murein transglycosylase D